jgi:hypothetical protein
MKQYKIVEVFDEKTVDTMTDDFEVAIQAIRDQLDGNTAAADDIVYLLGRLSCRVHQLREEGRGGNSLSLYISLSEGGERKKERRNKVSYILSIYTQPKE